MEGERKALLLLFFNANKIKNNGNSFDSFDDARWFTKVY